MKISVITVCYNSVFTLEDSILSVAAQSYPDLEHLIVDGGSTDGTLSIIKKHQGKISNWISEPDNGMYDAMNKGIDLATGEIIGFLNSDDIYADNSVIEQVASVFSNTSVDSCYADLVYVQKTNLDKVIRYWQSCDYREGLFERGWCPAHPTFFVRKNIYEMYGNFDLNYNMGNDVELMMRFLYKYKIESLYIPRVLVKMRTGGESNRSISNIIRQNIEVVRAGKNNGVKFSPLLFFIHKIFARFSQFIPKHI